MGNAGGRLGRTTIYARGPDRAITRSGRVRITAISRHHWDVPFKGHAILIWGALGATLLGALTALQLDLVIAAGERLLHPVGQEALLRAAATAGLAGLLCWVLCALVTRAISRHALRPCNALADHLERLADGGVDSPPDLRGSPAAVRRLARAAVFFQQRDLASRRSEAALRALHDRLCQEQADERHLLIGMLMSGRLDAGERASLPQSTGPAAPVGLERPPPPEAIPAFGGPAMETGRIVDLTGRLRPSSWSDGAAPAAVPATEDPLSLDFAFIRR